MLGHLRAARIVLPAPARIERIGVAGRAMARRLAADTLVDAMQEVVQQRRALLGTPLATATA